MKRGCENGAGVTHRSLEEHEVMLSQRLLDPPKPLGMVNRPPNKENHPSLPQILMITLDLSQRDA